jgi:two-component system sensor histidine kinase GlrK
VAFKFKPASVFQLILIAFALVTLPLIFVVGTATVSVGRLSNQGQHAILNAARTVQLSRTLVEQLTDMERNARQYGVLQDPALYKLYAKRHKEFNDTAQKFANLKLAAPLRDKLDELTVRERAVFAQFSQHKPGSKRSREALGQFDDLSRLARSILADSSAEIGSEVGNMQQAAGQLKKTLGWQAATVVPAVIVVAIISIVLIARPISATEAAIRRLGAGDLEKEIHVHGPKDLEDLGHRLDWLRQRFKELEAHRIRFLQHVSHDLKTPLTAIREGAQLLTDQVLGELNGEQQEVAEILRTNSLRLQERIEDLLNFSANRQAVLPVEQRPIALQKLVDDAVAAQRVALRGKELAVHVKLQKARVVAEREKLRVVIDNLLSNAIKYSPHGGIIGVRLKRRRKQAVLTVEDQGPGISEADRERIFEAYYQGDAVYVSHVKGTGLGLAIAREYTRAQAGDIKVLDANKPGAHLEVTLPLTEA